MTIKRHLCRVCGKIVLCDADYCFVPDSLCGKDHGAMPSHHRDAFGDSGPASQPKSAGRKD